MLFSRSEGAEFKLNRGTKKSIAANPLFVPAMAIWGAALGGFGVFVLPESMIRSITETSGLGVLGAMARTSFSGLAAALGAAILYFVAKKFRAAGSGGDASTLVNKAKKRVRPIDPAADLGSDSLDAPLELDEFADEDDALELVEEDCVAAADEPVVVEEDTLELVAEDSEDIALELEEEFEPVDDSAWVEELAQDIPDEERELTLGEWCEPYADEEAEPVQKAKGRATRAFSRARQAEEEPIELVKVFKGERAKHAAEAKPIATEICDASEDSREESPRKELKPRSAPPVEAKELPTGSAADLLRNTPADDLSLVQMVERLALALNDHREARISAAAARSTAKRDAALAEALRALTRFTEQGLEPAKPHNTNEPEAEQLEMEEALAKLQSLRGAA